MSDRVGVEEGTALDDVRKRIARPFERIRRERRQRLDVAHDAQPVRDRPAVGPVPAIDGDRDLRLEEQHVRNRSEQEVVRRVGPRHHLPEPGDPARRWNAARQKRRAHRGQARRRERLALDALEQRRQQTQVALGRFDGVKDVMKRMAPEGGERGLDRHP